MVESSALHKDQEADSEQYSSDELPSSSSAEETKKLRVQAELQMK